MKRLSPDPVLTNTSVLAERWRVSTRTVLRWLRIYKAREICPAHGRILFIEAEVLDIEHRLGIRLADTRDKRDKRDFRDFQDN
jgi:hypothetical protein